MFQFKYYIFTAGTNQVTQMHALLCRKQIKSRLPCICTRSDARWHKDDPAHPNRGAKGGRCVCGHRWSVCRHAAGLDPPLPNRSEGVACYIIMMSCAKTTVYNMSLLFFVLRRHVRRLSRLCTMSFRGLSPMLTVTHLLKTVCCMLYRAVVMPKYEC